MPTNKLNINTILQNQNNKYITINEAFNFLEAVACSYISGIITTDGDATNSGSLYIVSDSATGTLATQQGKLAYNLDGVLIFLNSQNGMQFRNETATETYTRVSGQWVTTTTQAPTTVFTEVFNLTVNAGGSAVFQLSQKAAEIQSFVVDQPCRVRAYRSIADRNADTTAGNVFAVDANLLDYGNQVNGANDVFKRINVAASDAVVPMRVYNNTAATYTISLTVNYLS